MGRGSCEEYCKKNASDEAIVKIRFLNFIVSIIFLFFRQDCTQQGSREIVAADFTAINGDCNFSREALVEEPWSFVGTVIKLEVFFTFIRTVIFIAFS